MFSILGSLPDTKGNCVCTINSQQISINGNCPTCPTGTMATRDAKCLCLSDGSKTIDLGSNASSCPPQDPNCKVNNSYPVTPGSATCICTIGRQTPQSGQCPSSCPRDSLINDDGECVCTINNKTVSTSENCATCPPGTTTLSDGKCLCSDDTVTIDPDDDASRCTNPSGGTPTPAPGSKTQFFTS